MQANDIKIAKWGMIVQSLRNFTSNSSIAFKLPFSRNVKPSTANDADRFLSPKHTGFYELEEHLSNSTLRRVLQQVLESLDGKDTGMEDTQNAVTDSMRLQYLQLAHALLQTTQNAGLTLHHILGNDHDPYSHIIEQSKTLCEYRSYLMNLCQLIGNYASSQRKGKNQRTVCEAITYIEKHFSEDFGLDQLAETMHCSSTYLNRLLKQHAGNTFYNLLTQKRIDHSKRLLSFNYRTVNQISNEVGYNNVHSFIRAFKRSEGMTPGQYRECMGIGLI
ncbi:helix-turn-helix transcriptional regulator [Paenibacillus aestuarii]|uniref:Helix-turn-helix transcriptional regulator n=1 Tax=Paenibacillus aestuarii TaxID=516965 RepID=A0ABW0KGG7_9BACL|nr:AraC family transcriptional regulator [Paenibacillus aestuarii]